MNDRRGFQLIELMVVLALMGVAGGLGLSGWQALRDGHLLARGVSQFVAHLREARAEAISRNTSIGIRVGSDARSYALSPRGSPDPAWSHLPEGVIFRDRPPSEVRFFSRGHAAPAGSYVIGHHSGAYRIIVAPSGRIRSIREEGQ